MIGFVVLASAVVSNTPVVVVMIPVFVQLAKTLEMRASKLLILLSYAAILGGTLTLIARSASRGFGRCTPARLERPKHQYRRN